MFITRIYFRIQIKFSKQSVGSLFTGAAILASIAVQQISIDISQFGLDVFKHLCSGVTRRKEATHRIVFCYERDIAEKIECMIIGQSTDKASLSTVMPDVCLFAFSELGNLIITRIAQEATVSGDLAYYEVTMTVPQDGTLAMGLSCEIRVLYQSVKNVTTVSIDAIQYDSDGKPFVYCYDRKDDIVQQRVTLGINNGSIVEIVDGIRTGEAVLIPVKNTMEMPMMHY